MEYILDINNICSLLEILKDDDLVKITGKDLIRLIGKKSFTAKGRKPIEVDKALFDETVRLWQDGTITAREAMRKLNLKPNTFYRRIKEGGAVQVKDIFSDVQQKINSEKEDIDSFKKQIHQDISDSIAVRHIEHEIKREKIAAEINGIKEDVKLKSTVKKEAKKQKASCK